MCTRSDRTLVFVLLTAILTVVLVQVGHTDVIEAYIDPGHGGTQPGCTTAIPGYYEKDINLVVCTLRVKPWFDASPPGMFNAMYSRLIDTTVQNIDRAYQANAAGCSTFVSIHHNCFNPCNQYHLTLYSSVPYPEGDDNPWHDIPRDTTSLLARKLGYKIRDAFRFGEGLEFPLNGPTDALYTKTVLSRTYMASAITEASFICDPLEAYRFYNDPSHAENEGDAIIIGWYSYWYGQGLAIVEYECYPYDLGVGRDLMLSAECNDWYHYATPYYGCWLAWPYSETYCLYAPDYTAEGHNYTFHHWEFRDWLTGELYDTGWNPYVSLQVEADFDDSTHYYVAYFKGGPFDDTLKYPTDTTTEIQKNDSITIEWWAPEGAGFAWSGGKIYTCSLYIDLSTNGGSTWQHITDTIPYNNGYQKLDLGKYDWLVPNVTSNNCYLRFIAWDRADNHDTLISHRFGIDCYKPKAQSAFVV
jgi:N-acetylmuramoyl-L-alanine amidase